MLMEPCNISANNDETHFSGDHNSPCDGKTVLLSVFSNSPIVLTTIYHLGGRCRCQFSVPTTRLFRFVRTATFFPSTSFGNREEERDREKERERQKVYMRQIVCTLMRSVTCGIDVPRRRTRRNDQRNRNNRPTLTLFTRCPRFISRAVL